MFVTTKTHRALQAQLWASEMARVQILREWNALVKRINAKGGEAFLNAPPAGGRQLDDEDIRRLLMLCHPDKHGGKEMAHEMTQKLLALRGKD